MRAFRLLGLLAALAFAARASETPSTRAEGLRPHFMLGIASSPADKWVEETTKQGAKWDMRYQYICGGVNTGSNWKTWNQPQGAFASFYLDASEKMGCIPVLSYYQMLQSAPGAGRGEPEANRVNVNNAGTMKSYFDDFKVLLEKSAALKKPVILHVEPDLWGYFLIAKEFAPNDPDKTAVMVKSSGHEDVKDFEDTVAGFGKALVALRDKYAPNVLLAWHASLWGRPEPKFFADAIKKCGAWDLIFTDPSDRDSAWRIAKNYHAGGAWWTDKDFVSFRDWSKELHQLTGLPLMAWQVPMGNTIMATCNNTEGHYMDNRPEYFLEDYPKNTHIAEWVQAGYIGLLFGGGAGGCTDVRDGCKDGVTNPDPIPNNKGEKAEWPDDDGGYLRTRGINYYTKGAFPLKGPPPKAAAPAKLVAGGGEKKDAPAAPPPPPKPKLEAATLDAWQAKLVEQAAAQIKKGKKPTIVLKIFGGPTAYPVASANEKELAVSVQGNAMPMKWEKITLEDKVSLAKSMADEANAQSLLLVAVLLYGSGQNEQAEDFLAKAALVDANAAQQVKDKLVP
ncbi:MAG: hypothetical protein KIS92_25140 [Planctomycetota bacterium]|nr:hypothetical protein [Planctomycetota bacterium]